MLVRDGDLLSILKGVKDFINKKSGVVIRKMISEILLHLASVKYLIPLLVSNVSHVYLLHLLQGMIGYLIELRISIMKETVQDH